MSNLTDKIFNDTYLRDVANDFEKVKQILENQHALYHKLLWHLDKGDIKTSIKIVEDILLLQIALKELWGLK